MHIREGKLSEGVLAAAIRLQPYYWKETKRSKQAAMTRKITGITRPRNWGTRQRGLWLVESLTGHETQS